MNDISQGLSGRLRIGIDVGGTFTDFVMADAQTGRVSLFKEPSTPDDPAQALIEGLGKFLEREGMTARDVGGLMHGTTIGLNAIIQRRGADIGLIVTKGYRDILEIARCRMPSSFDLHAQKEVPLVSRARVIEIDARFDRDGNITREPDAQELDRVAGELAALKLDAAALMLINGYANPEAEGRIAQALAQRLKALPISSAAQIWPEIREYERTLVACLNAYIQPLMAAYFDRLTGGLKRIGVTAPLLVTASNGGSLSVASAMARPVETILSGPASGVMAAVRQAGQSGMENIITFDMGGTSSDMAVATDGTAGIATRTDIGGLPLVLPVVDVNAIGAGGGSIIWADAQGVLKVGPQSAGAHPGPVSYGRGGTEPTVTDCFIACGFIDPAMFGGGAMPLDGDAARTALNGVADRIGLTGADREARLAEGALAVACAGMAGSLFRTMAERGLDPRDFVLLPFGGAGPTQANLLAEEIGIARILVPQAAGAYCAMGAAGADLRRDFVRSLRVELNDDTVKLAEETFASLQAEGETWLADELPDIKEQRAERSADIRYAGQAYELRVSLSAGDDVQAYAEAFHREHERIYGFRDTDAPVEIGTIRLAMIGAGQPLAAATATGSGAPIRTRRDIFHKGTWHTADVYDRSDLGRAATLSGPAIVEQPETTTVILPGWMATVDDHGNLIIERTKA
ncbi:hydantoinase/oxoprolinase family protein [Pseudooceanicola sediminis]|uniref:Hydantoinase/oxoprolinase family protein n=1 Tax=Pseudooceanicola sediminis TaxID=2211117 RepID=A0A399IWY4_9RHOB|nr:hydantoinase/oxoprolinase family protein [Pseudooceanicola sediminis]KAA2312415.1 hydantoinase/oxoprolinase family protein [Puniceibacterium sp. HSS470]RII37464.1 hydantoinase/oxoprolinase family protein [Pseudooceanicola sediminis]|tara:strand:+ start:8676 stop:10742 length:2067 start_codon:yes stop_codon:yes gene_type:complete